MFDFGEMPPGKLNYGGPILKYDLLELLNVVASPAHIRRLRPR